MESRFTDDEVTVVDCPVTMLDLVTDFEDEPTLILRRPLLEEDQSDGVPEHVEPERS